MRLEVWFYKLYSYLVPNKRLVSLAKESYLSVLEVFKNLLEHPAHLSLHYRPVRPASFYHDNMQHILWQKLSRNLFLNPLLC